MSNERTFKPFSQIIGQEKAIRFLKRVMTGEKIPHAYLFAGIQGVGKTTTAMALAQAINCSEPANGVGCGDCPSCRQIISGTFPDLAFINPDGQYIKIDQIRHLNRSISFKPAFGRYRVCIIGQAETMTDEAANAFLKILEEPPPENIFILNVSEPLDLLPTVVSRCQKISFCPIPIRLIADWLLDRGNVGEEKALVLARISEGSLGRAIEMYEDDFLEKREGYLSGMTRLPKITSVRALEMASEYAGKAKKKNVQARQKGDRGIFDLLSIWKTWYRDLLVARLEGDQDLFINIDFSEELNKISKAYKIDNIINSFFSVDQAQRDLQRSRNLDLIMENTVLNLKRLAK